MAYGLKYELYCTSKLNNFYKLRLLFDGYEGSEIDRNVPVSPFHLRKDRADVICGTSLEFGIREEVDFELLEFYTNSWKYIKAELYKSTTLIWTGYVAPQQYQTPYVPASRKPAIWFTATDGLGLLKNEDFTLTGNHSQLEIIMHCLDKLGLNLGYSIAIDLFEANHNETYSPLAQTYEDASIYEDLNCYEALGKMLEKYHAEISQVNCRWRIVSKTDKKSVPKLYTYLGVYESAGSAPAVLDLGYPGTGIEVSPVGTLQHGMQPGARKVKITHDFGKKPSFLSNYDFSIYESSMFTSWTKSGSFDVLQRTGEKGGKYAFLSGYSDSTTDYIQQSVEVETQGGIDHVFDIELAPIGYYYTILMNNMLPVGIPVKILVYLWDGASTYYYLTKTGWQGSFANLLDQELMMSSLRIPTFHRVRVTTDALPCSGTLFVRLYRIQAASEPSNTVYSGIAYANINIYPIEDSQPIHGKLELKAVFDNSKEPGTLSDMDILAADAPDSYNAAILYKNITKLSDGTPTQ